MTTTTTANEEYPKDWTMQNLTDDKFKVFDDDEESLTTSDPPPPFSASNPSKSHAFSSDQKQSLPASETTPDTTNSAPTYALQPHHTPTPLLTLPIKYTNWIGNNMHILPHPDAEEPIYTAHIKMTKPHIIISDPGSTRGEGDGKAVKGKGKGDKGRTVGTISYHALTTRIDTCVDGQDVPLTTTGKLKSRYNFTLPSPFSSSSSSSSATDPAGTAGGQAGQGALGRGSGRNLTWQFRKRSTDLLCVDTATGNLVARFHFGGFYWQKKGRLEVFDPDFARGGGGQGKGEGEGQGGEGGDGGLEGLLVSCVAVVHLVVFVSYTAIV
ncbi:uncharacterized protein KY384_005043 [Bacidia gigantensis]|uniref:uncharacterized protein n=1 Tax=Bacidia gigantensis TaxID=2732470 RepID=UPI001D044977|nr:uncharacterized protein KY384_005043 [Bacidia gigantensis]KAG8530540.1 hypothetical protein KY384_005043 [Bacidia gigantensis]